MDINKEKTVVMLGNFGHEGFSTTVEALGYELVSLSLDKVTPKTWFKRAAMLDKLQLEGKLVATVIYLHSTLLLMASRSEYRDAFMAIIQKARLAKLLIFVYQDNLDGIFAMHDPETNEPMTLQQMEDFVRSETAVLFDAAGNEIGSRIYGSAIERFKDYQERRQEINDLIGALYQSGAEIAPFLERSDVTIRLQEFLGDIDQGVFLRLFVPDNRLQANQLNGLLSVLERYLRQVERQVFSIDALKSEKGIVYLFKADGQLNDLQNLNAAFERFDSFMRLCGDNPLQAESILKATGMSDQDAVFHVDKYSRDYRRLILDIRHEFERKTLILRQKFESELIEVGTAPALNWPHESLSGLISAISSRENISVNIGHVSVVNADKIQSTIEQVVNGDITYNENDRTLLELFSRYADRLEALQYRSDLDQLKDLSTPAPIRKNAKQRLSGFIRKAAQKTGEVTEKVAVEILSKYIESMLKP